MDSSTQQQTFQCTSCSRSFGTGRGLGIHQATHNRHAGSDADSTPTDTVPSNNSTNTAADDSINRVNLPPFLPVNPLPAQAYNNIPGAEFANTINDIYEEIIKWRKNLFSIPSGQQGKKVIQLLSEWLSHYNNNTSFQGIALKVFMVISALMLQKPSAKSKARDHVKILSRRLELWQAGELLELIREGKIIQSKLVTAKRRSPEDIAQIFSKLMLQGKVSAALKFLDESSQNGILSSSPEVIDLLKEKHPPAEPIQHGTLIQGPLRCNVDLIHFAAIDEEAIHKAAMQTKGSCGPSHVDSDQFRRMLCSGHFKAEGKELREQIAIFARKIATEHLNPDPLEPYTSCRLIPLNKNPGVRPIGVGEVLRRIVGKTIAWSLRDEVQEAVGPLQVSSGIKGGAEAAIHAIRSIFEADTTDAVILVDASNAFNRLNRQVALHNIQYICHPYSQVLINTYRVPSRLFIIGGGEIKSFEGTTQGDPLAMQFYALGTNPLLRLLQAQVPEVKQVWLADDATGAGRLDKLKEWWDKVILEGTKLGYFVNQHKSWLILKNPDELATAQNIFENSQIKITTSGKRHLGAALGSQDFKKEYISEKVEQWMKEIGKLSEIAESQPQAAYSAYVHGYQHKFRYFLRTIANIREELKPLDELITSKLIPSIIGSQLGDIERDIISLPVRYGGMGIESPSSVSDDEYARSKQITGPLAAIIALQGNSLPNADEVLNVKKVALNQKSEFIKQKSDLIDQSVPADVHRNLLQAREQGASSWLSALPLEKHGFALNKSEFRDAIALRYGRHIENLPSLCVCGARFNVTHAMNCKRGGFINARHDSIRDFETSLLSKACTDVESEPHLQPVTTEIFSGRSSNTSSEARLDIRARGFWRRGQNAFFDVRVTNPDSASQVNSSIPAILRKHEEAKKREYNNRVMQIEQGTFTPLIFTTTGSMGPECILFHKSLAEKLAAKSGERYANVMSFIRCKLSFMCIRSSLLCLRGSRTVRRNQVESGCDFGLYNSELNIQV